MLRSLACRALARPHALRSRPWREQGVINVSAQRHLPISKSRWYSTETSNVGNDQPPAESPPPIPGVEEPKRKTASFFISNVLPIQVGKFDIRPTLAALRQDHCLEQIEDIATDVHSHGFRLEGLEIARKDGGVFLNYSYIPPAATTSTDQAVPERPFNPAKEFLPLLSDSARRHGGFPSWLGNWWASTFLPGPPELPTTVADEEVEALADGSDDSTSSTDRLSHLSANSRQRIFFGLGDGRCWAVRGRQWMEDMNRFPSQRVRVEFDGADVSQEVLYELFRPYGRLTDITPPAPVPAGNLRYAVIHYGRLRSAAVAINTLHGLSTPTNTRDFTLLRDSRAAGATQPTISRTRLRLFYERPIKAHAIRTWISTHPRIVIPVAAFLIGTLSYTFFDPIRAFFVKAKVDGYWNIEGYSIVKKLRGLLTSYTGYSFTDSAAKEGVSGVIPAAVFGDDEQREEGVGKSAWSEREEAEKQIVGWLGEVPGTFITITGPPGSGKNDLVTRVIADKKKKALIINCSAVAKAKSDAAVVSELADQTGYYPVFSFMGSISNMIDLAALGLIGQKAGFATPVDQQLKQVLEVVGTALKDISMSERKQRDAEELERTQAAEREQERRHRQEMIRRGGWHDGRLDAIAGNGVMSELGFGMEELTANDLSASTAIPGVDVAGLEVPSDANIQDMKVSHDIKRTSAAETDKELEFIDSLPVLVLDNFVQKASTKTELWNVLAEWGASLVENKIAHVIVVCDSSSVAKALTRAIPTKPLNAISLADADSENSMHYILNKLGVQRESLSPNETQLIGKVGGRMIDLELLVYKVRSGFTISEAVEDIIVRNVVELRKAAFGDDMEDSKALPWSRNQAWKIVSELAKKRETSYANILQDFPFKGQEAALKAMEEHDLIAVSFVDGRPSMIRAGKPVYRQAFQRLVADPVFAATCKIDQANVLIAKADSEIKTFEQELLQLREISPEQHPGLVKHAASATWSGVTFIPRAVGYIVTPWNWSIFGDSDSAKSRAGSTTSVKPAEAVNARRLWLLEKLGKSVQKMQTLEAEVAECKDFLKTGKA
ncbi:hypothetical protein NliqN6_4530 [Naganishia liquefaciens]|uniref:Mitochondrial escape protein 2 n=1 Tax=Naganishia liquefaciens TaxID=104408 RepID=A0A8H3TWH8_9TREE|nr:hypothetical protein NliqN6_4530 [Naganishia liquefaciens]